MFRGRGLNNNKSLSPSKLFGIHTQATSAADGCRDAATLAEDGARCPLTRLLAEWAKSGHEERSFSRLGFQL